MYICENITTTMKVFIHCRYFTGLFLLSTMLCSTSFAQSNHTGSASMKLDKMSDQQIMQIWQKSQESGLSESAIISQLIRSGLAPSEVNQFKKRLLKIDGLSRSSNSGSKRVVKDSAEFMNDSGWVSEVPLLKLRSRYYGYEFFSNPNPVMQPDIRVATPKNYLLGPGDQLSISITGINIKSFQPIVSAEGRIDLEYAGIISVSGLTIEQATQKIKQKLSGVYPGLNNGQTQLFITLEHIRSIRITVIGEAEKPGDYVVNGLSAIFNILYLSGGPTTNGSLRKIELIRNNQVIQTIDFYQFLQKGKTDQHVRLEDQDIIRFPLFQKKLIVSGEVRRPAIYELLEKETLADGLQYAGGFTELAVKDNAKIVQPDSRELSIRDVNAKDFGYLIPRNGDSVFIDKILSVISNQVILGGEVYRPGNYELTPGLTLAGLIRKADGLKPEAFGTRAYIKRRSSHTTEKSLISFDADQILAGKDADIVLQRDDSVVIVSKEGLEHSITVTVGGAVRNPGNYVYRKGMLLEDLILLANGFTSDAANHKVEISRLEKNKADTLANQLLHVMIVGVDSGLQKTKEHSINLEPYDYVFVPRLLNYRNLGSIKLGGEVLYSGEYALEKRNETVQEVIQRAGGITPYASMGDVQVYRNGLRVGTTLLQKSAYEKKFLLQPGDSIYIPRNEPFVEVKGAVFNPQILSFDKEKFMSYISDAGGITEKGNLKKAYIQYSNGINKKINRFLFIRSYPKVTAGSKIFVPEKSTGERKGLSILEVSAITGSLSALVSLISVLRK